MAIDLVPYEKFIEPHREKAEPEALNNKSEKEGKIKALPAPYYSRSEVRHLFRRSADTKKRSDAIEARIATIEASYDTLMERNYEIEALLEEMKNLFMDLYQDMVEKRKEAQGI